jgi:hypothetical protein
MKRFLIPQHLPLYCLICFTLSPVEASPAAFPSSSSCRDLITEMTHFLLQHKGPDGQGRVHPVRKSVHHANLEAALTAAQSLGLSPKVRAYHARFVINVWNEENLNEVLLKRIDTLLETKYQNDLAQLIMETTQDELFPKRFIESIGTKKLEISMKSLFEHFKGSPYLALKKYLQIKGRNELDEQIRPYHFRQSPTNTWTDRTTLNSILIKKFDQLLEGKYRGRMDEMISQTNQIELFREPLIETIDGMNFQVSMGRIGQIYRGSVYAALKDYLELKGLHELAESVKPYHLLQTQRGIWSQKEIRQEILVRKIDYLLRSRYLGDLAMLIGETNCQELFKTPLEEEIAGLRLTISMGNIGHRYGNSPYRALKEYLFLKGRPELAEKLRTYHLLYAAKGTWFTKAIIDEVIIKKIDHLLSTKYHGDIEQLIARTNQIELFRTHLMDQVEEFSLPVSMAIVSNRFHGSTALAIRRYLQLKEMDAPPILLKRLKKLLL